MQKKNYGQEQIFFNAIDDLLDSEYQKPEVLLKFLEDNMVFENPTQFEYFLQDLKDSSLVEVNIKEKIRFLQIAFKASNESIPLFGDFDPSQVREKRLAAIQNALEQQEGETTIQPRQQR